MVRLYVVITAKMQNRIITSDILQQLMCLKYLNKTLVAEPCKSCIVASVEFIPVREKLVHLFLRMVHKFSCLRRPLFPVSKAFQPFLARFAHRTGKYALNALFAAGQL